MWNPLHFAVYHNHLAIVKFILGMEVNVGLTVHKSCAESEKDPTNNLEFQEDKITLLLIALDRNNVEILSFLLNELSKFWTRKNFNDLINKLPPLIGRKGLQMRAAVFASKTAHAFFTTKSIKKRQQWLIDYVRQIQSIDYIDYRPLLIPFTQKPYVCHFLNYLLLEDYCSDVELLSKSLNNMTPCDYLQVIYTLPASWTDIPAVKLQNQFDLAPGDDLACEPESPLPERPSLSQIMSQHEFKSRISKGEQPSQVLDDASIDQIRSQNSFSQDELSVQNLSTPKQANLELNKKGQGGLAAYFDINRMMKLEEKFENEQSIRILNEYVDNLVEIQQKVGIEPQSNVKTKLWTLKTNLVAAAKSGDVDEFREAAKLIGEEFQIDVYSSLINMYDRTDEEGQVNLDRVPQSRISVGVVRPQDETMTPSKKWHPLTYAIHTENSELVDFLVDNIQSPLKKLLWVPELSKYSTLNQMFAYRPRFLFTFWNSANIVPKEDLLVTLLRMSELSAQDLKVLIDSSNTQELFCSMSYQYRYTFMETIIQLR